MTPFFVRTAGERDLPVVSRLLAETWHATFDAIYGADRVAEITGSWHTVKSLRQRLKRPQSEFLVADDGTELAGMAYAAAAGTGRAVLLHQLYVRPAWQRRGIGRELLAEVEGCFPAANTLRVEVEAANTPAVRFYGRNGFAEIGPTLVTAADAPAMPAMIYEKRIG